MATDSFDVWFEDVSKLYNVNLLSLSWRLLHLAAQYQSIELKIIDVPTSDLNKKLELTIDSGTPRILCFQCADGMLRMILSRLGWIYHKYHALEDLHTFRGFDGQMGVEDKLGASRLLEITMRNNGHDGFFVKTRTV